MGFKSLVLKDSLSLYSSYPRPIPA